MAAVVAVADVTTAFWRRGRSADRCSGVRLRVPRLNAVGLERGTYKVRSDGLLVCLGYTHNN